MIDWAGEIEPDVAVAPTFNVTAGNAGGGIWNVCAPTLEPSAAGTVARPRLSALTVVSAGAPPVGARKRTAVPATGRLSAARTATVSGTVSVCPTIALWPPPAINTSWVGTGWNVTCTESAMPPGVRARTRTELRVAGACSTPKPFTRASAESLVLQLT